MPNESYRPQGAAEGSENHSDVGKQPCLHLSSTCRMSTPPLAEWWVVNTQALQQLRLKCIGCHYGMNFPNASRVRKTGATSTFQPGERNAR